MILARVLQVLAAVTAFITAVVLVTKGAKVIAPVAFGLQMAAMLWAAAAMIDLLADILAELRRH